MYFIGGYNQISSERVSLCGAVRASLCRLLLQYLSPPNTLHTHATQSDTSTCKISRTSRNKDLLERLASKHLIAWRIRAMAKKKSAQEQAAEAAKEVEAKAAEAAKQAKATTEV